MSTSFGELLRRYREQSKEPHSPKRLTQQRLGELLGEELGLPGGYSGAAISDWERGESVIHHNDRLLLISIIKVLYGKGGIENIPVANELLTAGNYKSLDLDEQKRIFPKPLIDDAINTSILEKYPNWILFLSKSVFFENRGLTDKLVQAEEGPPPSWPRKLMVLINDGMGGWDINRVLRLLLWFLVWLLGYWLLLPSLRWPFAGSNQALLAMFAYSVGSLLVPILVGLLTNAKNNPFWKALPGINPLALRLYVYQGAFVGFHVFYFLFFALNLARYYLDAQPAPWWNIAGMTGMLVSSYLGAQVIPYNIWRAFQHLFIADGAIFFIFIPFGPAWGYFFLTQYPTFLDPVLGVLAATFSCALIIFGMAWQGRKTGSTLFPAHWWVFVFGAGLVLYQITVAENIFSIAALAGMILTFGVLLAMKRIQFSLPGLLAFLAAAGALQYVLFVNLWVGRFLTLFALLAWWRWGRKCLSFPPLVWRVIASLVICSIALQQQWLPDLAASAIFSVMVLLLLWRERRNSVSPQRAA